MYTYMVYKKEWKYYRRKTFLSHKQNCILVCVR